MDGRWAAGNKKQMCDHSLMSCNHQGDIIILVIKIVKIGRFVILKSISITREFGSTHLVSFELVFFLIVELSWQNICPLLNDLESILPFMSGNQPYPDGAKKSPSAEPRNNSFIISLCNLKYERALKFAVWKTSQYCKPSRLQHREQFIHVIWFHGARKQCTSLQPFMNLLVNVMSF